MVVVVLVCLLLCWCAIIAQEHCRSSSSWGEVLTFPFPFRIVDWHEQKKASESLAGKLKLVIKSGKYNLGYRSTLKTLRSGKGMLFAKHHPQQ